MWIELHRKCDHSGDLVQRLWIVVLIWISLLDIYLLVQARTFLPTLYGFSSLSKVQLFYVTPESYSPIVDSVLSHYSWCHSCLNSFISMVDRYFMPTGSRLLRTQADEHISVKLSWVELSRVVNQYMSSWVELGWVGLDWVASCRLTCVTLVF